MGLDIRERGSQHVGRTFARARHRSPRLFMAAAAAAALPAPAHAATGGATERADAKGKSDP